MSQILTNEWCNKCNTDNLTEEYYLDGYSKYCTKCGYLEEYFENEEEILTEKNN